MITFNSNHLSTIHRQAHACRDLLIELEIVDNVPSKCTWLNMFAQALTYKDWGELNHLSASFAKSQCFHVLTPENLPLIAKSLREQIGEAHTTADIFESLLLSVATTEEKILNGVNDDFCIKGPNAITLICEPEPFYAMPLLKWLLRYEKSWLTLYQIEEPYLAKMKRARRGLSRTEVKENHYDVYPNSGHRVQDILNVLESDRFVEFSESRESIRLSDIGIQIATEHITDNYGPKWQNWWSELRKLIKAEPYMTVKDNWTRYVIFYGQERTPKEYISIYSPQNSGNPHTANLERVTNH